MKIAFISFEFPPLTAFGGIATYVFQVSKMLAQRGHHVEVFCASFEKDHSELINGLWVHQVFSDRSSFNQNVVSKFGERHKEVKFDLAESPEYGADGIEVFKAFPDLVAVVKTHTPDFLIRQINPGYAPDFISKVKMAVGAVRRLNLSLLKPAPYRKEEDPEYQITRYVDCITTPSISLGDIISKTWDIPRSEILNQPYPYIPVPALLDIPIEVNASKTVTFIGRLEIRKGMLTLADAIPHVLKERPDVVFQFVGQTSYSPDPKYTMDEYLKLRLNRHLSNIRFLGKLNLHEMARVLKTTAVSIYPSIWENFPNVCLEAMSAGKAIIGTDAGGMSEMLADGAGVLVPPANAKAISSAVIDLIDNPQKRYEMGFAARQKVLKNYNAEVIGLLMEDQYHAIIKKSGKGTRLE